MRDVSTITSMLKGNTTNVAVLVNIQERVFIKIFGLSYLNRTKLNVQRVGLLKIFDLHSINLRSKKALGQFFGQTAVYQTLELREMKPPDTRPAIDFHIKPVYAF